MTEDRTTRQDNYKAPNPSPSGKVFKVDFSGTLNWARKFSSPPMKSRDSADFKNGTKFYHMTFFDHV